MLFSIYAIIIMTKRAGLLYNQKKLTGGESCDESNHNAERNAEKIFR